MQFVFPNDLWTFFYRVCLKGVDRGVKSSQFEVDDCPPSRICTERVDTFSVPHTRQMTGKHIMFNGSKQAATLSRYLHHSKTRTLSVSAVWKAMV